MSRPTSLIRTLLSLAVLASLTPAAAIAASSASSASSDGASTSVGSSSTSIEKSSASSSKDEKVAAGDYRIVQIAALGTEPARVRVTLQTLDGREAFDLLLPTEAATQGRLAAGGVVTAQTRAWGTEFTAAATQEAFFLVLDERWHQDLRTRAVTL
ncbi:MAG: hypothetical protein LH480_04725 [Rubrivivax sp.]|nr:hypothetical protein [Rubrivivax sp.]